MTDEQKELATNTIRTLIDAMTQPPTNCNQINKTELIEVAENVIKELSKP